MCFLYQLQLRLMIGIIADNSRHSIRYFDVFPFIDTRVFDVTKHSADNIVVNRFVVGIFITTVFAFGNNFFYLHSVKIRLKNKPYDFCTGFINNICFCCRVNGVTKWWFTSVGKTLSGVIAHTSVNFSCKVCVVILCQTLHK